MFQHRLPGFPWEPPVANAPGPMPRDWVLVAVFAVAAVLEAVLRTDVVWPMISLVVILAILPTLLIRRTHPLTALGITFASLAILTLASLFGPEGTSGLGAGAFALILVYSLFRWGAEEQTVRGNWFMVVMVVVAVGVDWTGYLDAVVGGLILWFPALLGLLVRYRTHEQERRTHDVRTNERMLLARELHDTVAHHVAAIAIQAQAAQAVAAVQPAMALEALSVIEEEASRTLDEMRLMVSALRDTDAVELAPQQGIADIAALAPIGGSGPTVDVAISGNLEQLRPSVDAAVFRMAQESITNAQRHGRGVQRIEVKVVGERDRVRLAVHDDGDTRHLGPVPPPPGFGVAGMAERAQLLGGRFEAGPAPEGGWAVLVEIPRSAAA